MGEAKRRQEGNLSPTRKISHQPKPKKGFIPRPRKVGELTEINGRRYFLDRTGALVLLTPESQLKLDRIQNQQRELERLKQERLEREYKQRHEENPQTES